VSASGIGLAPASPGVLLGAARHWRLAAFVLLGFGPFLPSIVAMRQFLLADNALGFVPFVIVIAAIAFWVRSFPETQPGKRDVFVDAFLAIPLGVLAIYVLAFVPDYLSWYFWLFRVDLLALPLFVVAMGLVCLGYQRVLLTAPAFIVLFLLWPYPIVRFQQFLVDPFVNLTTSLTGSAVRFLALPYVQDPAAPERFLSQHLADADNFELIISQACAGTSTFIAFALFAVASMAFTRGSLGTRVRWLALGLGLAVCLNFVRIIALLLAAVTFSEHVAIDIVHPTLGLVLFALLVAGMLALVRPMGLEFSRGARGPEPAWVSAGNGGGRGLVGLGAIAVAGAVVIGTLDAGMQRYSFLQLGQGAPTVNLATPKELLVPVPGWDLEFVANLNWTDLFGRNARGDVFSYQDASGGPGIVVQHIVTEDKATLDRYPVEQCVLFHYEHIDSIRRVELPWGTTGSLVRSNNGKLWTSALSWQFPVQVDGVLWHARATLFLDTEEPMRDLADEPEVRAFADALRVSLAAPAPGADLEARRAHVDLQRTALAPSMIRQMVAPGGPAASGGGG